MLNPGQIETARVAVWLLDRAGGSVGAVAVEPGALGAQCGLAADTARRELARLAAQGYASIERRAGMFWCAPTAAGRAPLGAYALAFAAAMLGVK